MLQSDVSYIVAELNKITGKWCDLIFITDDTNAVRAYEKCLDDILILIAAIRMGLKSP